jgi:hypothetical protein
MFMTLRVTAISILALTLAACTYGPTTGTKPAYSATSIPPTMNRDEPQPVAATPPATMASINDEVGRIDAAKERLTTITDAKAVSARRGNVKLTAYYQGGTLRKMELNQVTTIATSTNSYDELIDGTPPETYYFDGSGHVLLARTWGSRWGGPGSEWALQKVDYYYDGNRPLDRLVDGVRPVMINYSYEYGADDLRKEIATFVSALDPSTAR